MNLISNKQIVTISIVSINKSLKISTNHLSILSDISKSGVDMSINVVIMAPQAKFGRHIVFAPFLIYYYSFSFFRQKFVQHISRRCLDQTLWNLVGISYAMWSCAFKWGVFQNGQNAFKNKKNEKTQKWS